MKQAITVACLAAVIFSGCNSSTVGTKTRAATGRFTGRTILTLYTSDVEKLTQFYRDVLGFEFLGYWDYDKNGYVPQWPTARPPIYAGFKAGNQKIGIHMGSGRQAAAANEDRCYFEVIDLMAEFQRIKATGTVPSNIISTPGLKMFAVIDPDGRTIVFAANQNTSAQDLF